MYNRRVVGAPNWKEEKKIEAPISNAEYELLAEFRYALRRFLRFSEQAAEEAGLTPQQHQALLTIRGFPGEDPITIGEMADRLKLRPHSIVGLADRLSAHGLVERRQAAGDRRQVYLMLTPRGAQVLEQLTAAHRDELRRLHSEMSLLLQSLGQEESRTEAAP